MNEHTEQLYSEIKKACTRTGHDGISSTRLAKRLRYKYTAEEISNLAKILIEEGKIAGVKIGPLTKMWYSIKREEV